jgi:hypothetical protein
MLGIPLAPDFGSCILCYTPIMYAQNFFASLKDWIDDYIRAPLCELVGIEKRSGIRKNYLPPPLRLYARLRSFCGSR